MRINIPNQITIGRLVLSIVFFALLAQFSIREQPPRLWLLDVCGWIFIVAGLSDVVDGYLARRQNQVTSFGRVIDPFVDKVLVCGAFAFFAGPGFSADGRQVSGVAVWMVVLVLGRELLVTGVRGFSEARGESFAANVHGKVKMFIQSLTTAWILFSLAHPDIWGAWFFHAARHVLIWTTVIVTVLSVISYLGMARHILSETARPVETA